MKTFLRFLQALFIVVFAFQTTTYAADWYDSRWKYRRLITCSNPQANYVMSESVVEVYYDDGTKTGNGQVNCGGNCQTDFDDIIFTESDGTTLVTNFDVQNEIASTSAEFILIGDSDKYIYYGNADYDPGSADYWPNNCIAQYGYTTSTHQYNQPNGIYSAADNKVFIAWADAAYAPWMTYYDTTTDQWATSAYQVAVAGLADLHAAPSMWRSEDRFHVAWGAHASDMYYQRSIVADTPPDIHNNTEFDFTSFTEVDPSSHITVAAGTITASAISRNESAYVYKDMTAGYFSDSWALNFSYDPLVIDDYAKFFPVVIGENYGEMQTLSGNKIAVQWYYTTGGAADLRLYVNSTFDTYAGAEVDTDRLYCTLYYDPTVNTYGTIYLFIYSDSTRLTLVDTLAVGVPAESTMTSLRYLQGATTINTGSAATCSMAVYNFDQIEWLPRQVFDIGTYPQFHQWSDGGTDKLYVSYRQGLWPYTQNYRLSTDDGLTWGASTVYVEDGGVDGDNTYGAVYIDDVIMMENGDQYICFYWMYYDNSEAEFLYEDVYFAFWDESDSRWENLTGTDLGTSISRAEAIASCTVFDSTNDTYNRFARIALDGNNYPAIAFNDQDDVNGSHCYFTRWNGSSWESLTTIATSVMIFELFYISGDGATAVYDLYQDNNLYESTDGGATFSASTWLTASTDGYATRPIRILNGGMDTSLFTYMHRPYNGNYFPYTCRVYPEPADTYYYHSAGYMYTFKDIFDRDAPGVMLGDYGLAHLAKYQLYEQATSVSQEAIGYEQLYLMFVGVATGNYKKLWTAHDFDTSTWDGYKIHIEVPNYTLRNGYTYMTFGTVADGTSWDTTAINLPNDGIWLCVDTNGGYFCDVSAQIAGAEVINDDNNAITAADFDIYVVKDAGGDQITIKNNSGTVTVYSGTIPASGQLDDTVNIFMGQYASGGTSSNCVFDNVYFSPYSASAPTWTTVGSQQAATGAAVMIGF